MKIVIASDSFKGSLSGEEINKIWISVTENERKQIKIVPLLVADGGDGTLDAIIRQKKGKIVYERVNNPLFEKMSSRYGVFEDCAIISMCECSGLTLIPERSRNPLKTTSYGTGELIRKAVLSGRKKVYITLGGSATNDGGMGALSALGYKFVKKDGSIAKGTGEELGEIVDIDGSGLINLNGTEFVILSDVINPLTGENGATRVFAKQKGANQEQIDVLESGMLNFKRVIESRFNVDVNKIIGGGAAGGMGAGLSVMLNAKIVSGAEEILNIVNFDDTIKDADYIITGEGKIDGQSKDGKVISGVLNHAKARNIPVIAIVGTIGSGYETLYDKGLTSVFSIIDKPSLLQDVLIQSEKLYKNTAKNILRLLKQTDRNIKKH